MSRGSRRVEPVGRRPVDPRAASRANDPVWPPPAAQAAAARRRLHPGLVGGLCAFVYLTSLRAVATWDTIPARLLPYSILREGNLDLNEFEWLQRFENTPYFLRQSARGRLSSAYPIVTPLVATPVAIPLIWWLEHHQIADTDVRFRLATVVSERIAAALIAGASVSLVFLGLCQIASPRLALVLALGYGLGTNTWATSSQALWQHGMAELSLAALSLCLLLPATRTSAMAAGACAALGVLARPTMGIFALVAAAFMWRERRARMPAFLVLPALGLAAMLVYDPGSIARVFSSEHRPTFHVPNVTRIAGLLVSPNRGLFVYSPLAVLALPAALCWRRLPAAWLRYALLGTAGYVVLYGSFRSWWAGDTYGPRFLVDVLPAVVLCAVAPAQWLAGRAVGRMVLATLIVWGVAVQAIGVYCDDGAWNRGPPPMSGNSWRVWDVSDLQIARALRAGWHGTDLAPLLAAAFSDPRPARLQPLGKRDLAGWLEVEEPAGLRFRAGGRGEVRLRVGNASAAMWPAYSDYGFLQCKVAYVWRRDGRVIEEAAGALPLPRNLGPGDTATFTARVEIPPATGAYELELAVVQVVDVATGLVGNAVRHVPVEVF